MATQSIKTVAKPKERHHKTYWNQIPELLDRETLQFLLDTDLTIQNISERLGCKKYYALTRIIYKHPTLYKNNHFSKKIKYAEPILNMK